MVIQRNLSNFGLVLLHQLTDTPFGLTDVGVWMLRVG